MIIYMYIWPYVYVYIYIYYVIFLRGAVVAIYSFDYALMIMNTISSP